jgi:hypothetical protein
MTPFTQKLPTLDNYWRAVILFGNNVASYKFALGKALLRLAGEGKERVTLQDLAEPFAAHLCEHLGHTDKQATSKESRFLEACRAFNRSEIDKDRLVETTVRLGFNNVIDAFHVVGAKPIPVQFFVDERQERPKAVRLTDQLIQLAGCVQFQNLTPEVEARWRLVETAWSLGLPPHLLAVSYESESGLLVVPERYGRRKSVTGSRQALNGYQKGKCFYCARPVVLDDASFLGVDVDHFFPHMLKLELQGWNLDGVWNLVLACRDCNRGVNGKSARVPDLPYVERLHARNEWLIDSHHPLRETIIAQTGTSEPERRAFLQGRYDDAIAALIHTWSPSEVDEPGI